MTIFNIPSQVQILKQKFTQSLGLPFRDLLPESIIQEVLACVSTSSRVLRFSNFNPS